MISIDTPSVVRSGERNCCPCQAALRAISGGSGAFAMAEASAADEEVRRAGPSGGGNATSIVAGRDASRTRQE